MSRRAAGHWSVLRGAGIGRLGRGAIPLWLLTLLVAAIGVDAFRTGFFADDFHFLDVARRVPLWRALLGQYGVWPWVRPLSRELYFSVVVAAGPAALALAHAISLSCLFGCAWLLWRVGRRLVGSAAAAVAAALFLSYDFTKFLAAWPSGFQDLFALLLTLAALDAYLEERPTLSLVWAALAPFAKEPAFIVFPLLLGCACFLRGERPDRAWLARLAGVFCLVVLLHVAARWTWHTSGPPPEALPHGRLPTILGQALGGFLSLGPAPGVAAAALALVAGISAAALCILASPPIDAQTQRPHDPARARGPGFVSIAAALGIAPIVAANLLSITFGHAYHLFPAVPWLALVFGFAVTRLPSRVWRIGTAALVAWNVWGLGYAPLDLDRARDWMFVRLSWQEAVRSSEVARRLSDDVRELLAVRPESLVVLYEEMPPFCMFQTEDGPATREALLDASVRTFWVNDPPSDVREDRLSILTFNYDRLHLERAHWSNSTAILRAINAILARRGRAANAFALYDQTSDSARFDFDRAYLRAAAALLEYGPDGFVHGLARAGLVDTLGTEPARLADPIGAIEPQLGQVFAAMLRHPLSAGAHAALADLLLARHVIPRAGLELRIAVTLDPTRWQDRYRLACLMIELGGVTEALVDLREIAASPGAGALARRAREMIAKLPRQDQPKLRGG